MKRFASNSPQEKPREITLDEARRIHAKYLALASNESDPRRRNTYEQLADLSLGVVEFEEQSELRAAAGRIAAWASTSVRAILGEDSALLDD